MNVVIGLAARAAMPALFTGVGVALAKLSPDLYVAVCGAAL